MVNKGIVKYLKQGTSRGFSLNRLKKELLKAGFSKKDIEKATKQIKQHSKKPVQKKKKVQTKKPIVKHQHKKTLPKPSNLKGKKIPLGIKIISILYFIESILMLLIPLAIFVTFVIIGNSLAGVAGGGIAGAFGGIFGGIMFVILLPFIVLFIIVAHSLRKGRNWSRIIAIIISAIIVALTITELIGSKSIWGIIISSLTILINLTIAIYLTINKNIKTFFMKK